MHYSSVEIILAIFYPRERKETALIVNHFSDRTKQKGSESKKKRRVLSVI